VSRTPKRLVNGRLGLSAQLRETLRDYLRVREARVLTLAHERVNGGGESCPERPRFERADVGILEPS